MITALLQVNPGDIEIDNLQIWTEYESSEFWGAGLVESEKYVDWDELTFMGETIELEGDSLEAFKTYCLETYQ